MYGLWWCFFHLIKFPDFSSSYLVNFFPGRLFNSLTSYYLYCEYFVCFLVRKNNLISWRIRSVFIIFSQSKNMLTRRHKTNHFHYSILFKVKAAMFSGTVVVMPRLWNAKWNVCPGSAEACMGSPYMVVLLNLSILSFMA